MGEHWIVEECRRMRVGQALTVEIYDLHDCCPSARGFLPFFTEHDHPADRLMSKMMGSMWGCYTWSQNQANGNVTIFRNEGGDRVVFVDADRADMYRRAPDGFLELRAAYATDTVQPSQTDEAPPPPDTGNNRPET